MRKSINFIEELSKWKNCLRRKSSKDMTTYDELEESECNGIVMWNDLYQRLLYNDFRLQDDRQVSINIKEKFENTDLDNSTYFMEIGTNSQFGYELFNDLFVRFVLDDDDTVFKEMQVYSATNNKCNRISEFITKQVSKQLSHLGINLSEEEEEVGIIFLSIILDQFPKNSRFNPGSKLDRRFQEEIIYPLYKYQSLLEELTFQERKQSKKIKLYQRRIQKAIYHQLISLPNISISTNTESEITGDKASIQ